MVMIQLKAFPYLSSLLGVSNLLLVEEGVQGDCLSREWVGCSSAMLGPSSSGPSSPSHSSLRLGTSRSHSWSRFSRRTETQKIKFETRKLNNSSFNRWDLMIIRSIILLQLQIYFVMTHHDIRHCTLLPQINHLINPEDPLAIWHVHLYIYYTHPIISAMCIMGRVHNNDFSALNGSSIFHSAL